MNNYDEVIPIILAAGLGTRLEKSNTTRPKCLLEFDGKKLIEIQLELLCEIGVREVIIVVGHQRQEITSAIGETFGLVSVYYVSNYQYAATGSAYSLFVAFDKWKTIKKPVLLLHADILYDKKILLKFLSDNPKDQNTILIDENFEELTNDEQVVLTEGKKVIELIKRVKMPANAAGESLGINYWSVIYMEEYFNFLSSFLKGSIAKFNWEQTIKLFLENNPHIDLFFKDIQGRSWININYPDDREKGDQIFKSLKKK